MGQDVPLPGGEHLSQPLQLPPLPAHRRVSLLAAPELGGMLDASRGFLLLGIIFAFISALCCFNSFLRQASKFFPETNVSAMTCFTAGALGLLGSVTFLVFEIHVPPHPEIKHTYDWAFYLSWAVGPAFALAGISSLITQKHLPILGTKLGSQVAPEGGMGTSLA
ncbi:uncharacterized protein LOC142819626 isoform X2 [Pelodiscus sinensis]|uniref:uncharacterized protein LOC142819626 isoform X2 n=1 Tax=Pelodiscus sinensis TaxID=13735 RepID=UPI003F6C37D0